MGDIRIAQAQRSLEKTCNVNCKKRRDRKKKGKVDLNQKEWFCGKDVCEILGYENTKRALYEPVKQAHETPLEGVVLKTSITPLSLYQLIFKSKLPAVKSFKNG